MSSKIYDPNLLRNDTAPSDAADWYLVSARDFDIYGFVCEEGDILTRRIPLKRQKR